MKKYRVIFSTRALNDLEDAVYYYNEQQKGLGKRFAGQVQLALKSIKANPHIAPLDTKMCVCAQVLGVLYLVHYIYLFFNHLRLLLLDFDLIQLS